MVEKNRNNKENKLAPRNMAAPYTPGLFWREFDEIFDQFRKEMNSLMFPFEQFEEARFPATNIHDDGKNIVVEAEMPGLSKEDVNIEVTDKYIEIKGEKKEEKEEKDDKKKYIRKERSFTSYHRRIPLPEKIKPEEVKASMKDGVLKVTMPKLEAKQEPEAIKVKVE
ncbi:MAG: Hsp20/alpha crystallin family protein [Thermoplasmata archaeon]